MSYLVMNTINGETYMEYFETLAQAKKYAGNDNWYTIWKEVTK